MGDLKDISPTRYIMGAMNKKTSPQNGRPLSDAKIHKRLAELRKASGKSQAAVAEALGLSQVLISNYESGERRLHADLVVRFAKFYGVTTDDLLGVKSNGRAKKSPAADVALHLAKRMKKIEQLPKQRQKAVLYSIDMLLKGAQS